MAIFTNTRRLLLTVASAIELKHVLSGLGKPLTSPPPIWQSVRFDSVTVLHTGVGKAYASGAVAKFLSEADEHIKPIGRSKSRARSGGSSYAAVISVGLAGSLDETIGLKTTAIARQHLMLDEGSVLPTEPHWRSLEESGWARTGFVTEHGQLYNELRRLVDHVVDVGTVSTISGTNSLRDQYRHRGSAKIETMESAAIALVCEMLNIEYEDLRVISNFCGERNANNHDFPGALQQLHALVEKLVHHEVIDL